MGSLRGNAVRVTPTQFPVLHRLAATHARTLGMAEVPAVFVLQSGGALNAFATRFLGRDFVVIYSDVLEMAEARGEGAVGFIVGHELAHVRRGHLRHRWLTLPARMIPDLGAAWSRACEYTCDRMGAHCQPDGAIDGLLALGAGKRLYRQVNVREYAEQARVEAGFWVRWAELLSSHPHLPKRVRALLDAGVTPSVRMPEGEMMAGGVPQKA
jgi:Zn-dependent protease with chaperone function